MGQPRYSNATNTCTNKRNFGIGMILSIKKKICVYLKEKKNWYWFLIFSWYTTTFSITSNKPVRNWIQAKIYWAFKTRKYFSWDVVTATKVVEWDVHRLISLNCIVLSWAKVFFFPRNNTSSGKRVWYVNRKEIRSRSTFPFTTYHTFFIFFILIITMII